MKKCGIYKITTPSGGIYIGQSVDIYRRWNDYRKYKCKNQKKLLNSFKKYKVENCIFKIIELCLENQLNEKEKYWSLFYKTWGTKHGLNLRECGGSRGRHSEESIKKMKLISPEKIALMIKGRAKVGAWNKGLKNCYSKDIVERIKNKLKSRVGTMTGKKHSLVSRKKMSKSHSNEPWSEDRKNKNRLLRIKNKTNKLSETHKIKISNSNKGKCKSKEHKRKLKLAWKKRRINYPVTQERREKSRQSAFKQWKTKKHESN